MPKNVKCKDCNNLNPHVWWCEKVLDSPDTELLRDCQHFCQKTNGDHIRSLSDEKLALFICKMMDCYDGTCPGKHLCHPGHNGMVEWMKQAASEDIV